MSDYADLIDECLDQIRNEVSGFGSGLVADEQVHRYAPWDPALLEPDGLRHLAMWPVGESAEEAANIAQGFDSLRQFFAILAWEDGNGQAPRQTADVGADMEWLQIANSLRDYLYAEARRQRVMPWGGYYRVRYEGQAFPERTQSVRWVRVDLSADRTIGFT